MEGERDYLLSDSLLSGGGDVVLSARGLGSNTRLHGLAIKQVLPPRSDSEDYGTRNELAGTFSDIRCPLEVHVGPHAVSLIRKFSLRYCKI